MFWKIPEKSLGSICDRVLVLKQILFTKSLGNSSWSLKNNCPTFHCITSLYETDWVAVTPNIFPKFTEKAIQQPWGNYYLYCSLLAGVCPLYRHNCDEAMNRQTTCFLWKRKKDQLNLPKIFMHWIISGKSLWGLSLGPAPGIWLLTTFTYSVFYFQKWKQMPLTFIIS